jgi:hypothetical protein
LKSYEGKDLGATEWNTLKYDDIVAFANATGDHQWIHVDRERIKRESPFGAPIAHGYFTLSRIAGLFFEIVEVKKYRLAVKLASIKETEPGSAEGIMAAAVEIEGSAKPACVAEVVFRFMGG